MSSRNVSLALLFMTVLPGALAAAGEWKPLFNGKDLSGWQAIDGPESAWKVVDGMLVCSGSEGGWLSTTEQYSDFEIRVEFRVPKGGNSGVFLRAPHQGNPAFAGMEVQVLDDADAQYANLQPYQYCGSLYGLAAAKPRVSKPAGEWQSMHIRCVGRKVEVTLNGTQIVKANLDDYQDQLKEHPGVARTSGYLGLQNHGSTLEYRKVEVRSVD
ncbi:MAG: DUF1080 domain-containing protein [Pirellulales bacterium]|nr:DUF1080 domain-containing protein [Pirellulales bacterium]